VLRLLTSALLLALLTPAAGCRWLASYDSAGAPSPDRGQRPEAGWPDAAVIDGGSIPGDGQLDGAPDGTIADGGGSQVEGGSPADGGPSLPSSPCVGGWCWLYPAIATHDLRAVWGSDPNNLVIVGDNGTIVERKQGLFRTVYIEPGVSFGDVWGNNKGQVWVVGKPGVVLSRAAGQSSWIAEPLPQGLSTVAAKGVWGDKNGRVWAVTAKTVLVRELTGSWKAHTAVNSNLVDIWGNASTIIAFDASGTYLEGQVDQPTQPFVAKGGAPTTDIEQGFIDDNGRISAAANQLLVIHDGGVSTKGPPAQSAWHAVHGLQNGQNLWAIGEPGLIRWHNGSTWKDPGNAPTAALYDVHALAPDRAVICGAAGHLQDRNTAGATIQIENGVLQAFRDATALSGGGVALVAASFRVFAFDDQGASIGNGGKPPCQPQRIIGRKFDDLWVAGLKGVSHYDGNGWSAGYLGAPTGAVYDLWRGDAGEVWLAAGSAGVYSKGLLDSAFSPVALPTPGIAVTAIGGASKVVALGTATGQVYRRVGAGQWKSLGGNLGVTVVRLQIIDQTTLYAIKRTQVTVHQLWRYDANGWQQVTGAGVNIRDVWAAHAGEVWTIGQSGIARFNGLQWAAPLAVTPNTLLTIDGLAGRVYAAGARSTVLRR
jgi:hypothetical protein